MPLAIKFAVGALLLCIVLISVVRALSPDTYDRQEGE